MEYLYRYEDALIAPMPDEFDNIYGPACLRILLHKYRVTRLTPKGAWIKLVLDEKFVLLTARKRFACPTIEEAAESFKRRKEAQVRKLKSQLDRAEKALYCINNNEDDTFIWR